MSTSVAIPALAVTLDDAVFSLAAALDLVGIDEIAHGRRVAAGALAVAEVLEWTPERRRDLLHTALLHDCGVSTTAVHRQLVESGVEEPGPEVTAHCETGSRALAGLPRLASLAPAVLFHHTPWSGLAALDRETAENANLIFLADRVDVLRLRAAGSNPRAVREEVLRALDRRRGEWFAPGYLEALGEASAPSAFWYGLEDREVEDTLRERRPRCNGTPLGLADLRGIARIFSGLVDAKSRFTARHSEGVSMLSRLLAEDAGWEAEECATMEVAGFFHDIGKLRIPDALLEKPGPLDPDERETFKRHAFDTYRILRRMFPTAKVAAWAGYHHEWISGKGYPFGLSDRDLDEGARFVAAADVTQALLQTRPYRPGLPREEVLRRLHTRVELGQLDGDAVHAVGRVLGGEAA